MPANVSVDLVMTGNDDHGVKDATLHVTTGNEKLVSKNMLEGRPPQPEFKAIETLDLAKLRVKPGAKLNYWLTVRDNKEPSSNRFETAHQLIEVTQPVSPADKKKLEDSQKNNREQVEPTAASGRRVSAGKGPAFRARTSPAMRMPAPKGRRTIRIRRRGKGSPGITGDRQRRRDEPEPDRRRRRRE